MATAPGRTEHGGSQLALSPTNRRRLLDQVGALLAALGVLAGVWLVIAHEGRLFLARPILLVPAALWMIWPHKRRALRRVQEGISVYLILLVVLAAASVHWSVSWTGEIARTIHISAAWACLAIMGTGRLLQAWRGTRMPFCIPGGDGPLFRTIVILMAHAILLTCLLVKYYGYGWEGDGDVAARVGLCVIVMVLVVPLVRQHWSRSIVGIAIAVLLVWES